MNDSGYYADETPPIVSKENGAQVKPANKLQPKKLHFCPGSSKYLFFYNKSQLMKNTELFSVGVDVSCDVSSRQSNMVA